MPDTTAIGEVTATAPLQYKPNANANTQNALNSRPATQTSLSSAAQLRDDLATLSVTAQARLLQQQGLNAGEIADQLGIPVATVESYLDLTGSTTLTKAATA